MTDKEKPKENHERNSVSGDTIIVGDIVGGGALAIGVGAKAELITIQDDKQQDAQYALALNWDGKRRMREFDLSGRDLSGLSLAKADMRRTNLQGTDLRQANLAKANLGQANLSGTNLKGADLSEADLNEAKYTADTIWPDGFNPDEAGAILDDTKVNP